jgi:hypothetical protein
MLYVRNKYISMVCLKKPGKIYYSENLINEASLKANSGLRYGIHYPFAAAVKSFSKIVYYDALLLQRPALPVFVMEVIVCRCIVCNLHICCIIFQYLVGIL